MSYTKNKISQYLNVEKVRSRKRETNWHTHTHFSVHRLSWKENGTSGCLVERDILVTVHIPLFIYVFCCCSSVVQLCPTLCVSMAAALQASCPSPFPEVHSNSCPLSRWCHLTTSSSVVSSSHPQSFPASGSFPMSRLFASAGQSIIASA